STLLALGLALPLAAGCNPEPAESGVDAQAAPAAEVAAPAPAPAAPALSDPQIAHAAVTANAVDVEMGRLAASRASSPEVRAFAQTMITDHTAVNERAAALAGRLGVTPEDNAVSQSLQD